jgi:hypothetical protein
VTGCIRHFRVDSTSNSIGRTVLASNMFAQSPSSSSALSYRSSARQHARLLDLGGEHDASHGGEARRLGLSSHQSESVAEEAPIEVRGNTTRPPDHYLTPRITLLCDTDMCIGKVKPFHS